MNRSLSWSLLLAWLLAFGVGAADAAAFCTVLRSPLGVRLRAAPIAFAGVVERIDDGVAYVSVERSIRGEPASPVPMLDRYAGYGAACQEFLAEPGRFSVGDRLIVFGIPRGDAPALEGEPDARPGEVRPIYSGGLDGGAVFHVLDDGVRMEDPAEGLLFDTALFLDFVDGRIPLGDAALGPQAKEFAEHLDDPQFEPETSAKRPAATPPAIEEPKGCGVAGGSPGWWMLPLLLILPASSIGRPRRTRA